MPRQHPEHIKKGLSPAKGKLFYSIIPYVLKGVIDEIKEYREYDGKMYSSFCWRAAFYRSYRIWKWQVWENDEVFNSLEHNTNIIRQRVMAKKIRKRLAKEQWPMHLQEAYEAFIPELRNSWAILEPTIEEGDDYRFNMRPVYWVPHYPEYYYTLSYKNGQWRFIYIKEDYTSDEAIVLSPDSTPEDIMDIRNDYKPEKYIIMPTDYDRIPEILSWVVPPSYKDTTSYGWCLFLRNQGGAGCFLILCNRFFSIHIIHSNHLF